MPTLEDLDFFPSGEDRFRIEKWGRVIGEIVRIYPNGFDDMARWQPEGAGARYGLKDAPRSTVGGALAAFVGEDD